MEVYKLTDNVYPKVFLNCLYDMQKENVMCDIKLIVGEEFINAHKLVLNAVSPYFRWLEGSSFVENIENEIKFQNIDFKILNQIIEFIYTGNIMITESNVFDIMEATEMFRISLIRPAIYNFLIHSLNTNNCMQALAYAKQFRYEELADHILEFIWENFHFIISKQHGFLETPVDIVEIVLCSNSLNTNDICKAFEKWVKHNIKETGDFSFNNSLSVREYNLRLQELEKQSQYSSFISRFKQYISNRCLDNDKMINNDENPSDDSVDRKTEIQIIFVFGGDTTDNFVLKTNKNEIESSLSDVECVYDQNWSMQLPNFLKSNHSSYELCSGIPRMENARSQFAVANNKYQVFVMGGCSDLLEFLDSSEMYDINRNEWSEFHRLPKKLNGCKAALVDNVLYITGGVEYLDDPTNEVWRHNEREKGWKRCPNMRQQRAFHGACSVRGVLYAMGGTDATQGTVERYDENLERWFYVTAMPQQKFDFGCISYNEHIYIFGGVGVMPSGNQVLNSVHKYDTLTDIWEKCNDMLKCKAGMACAVKDELMYLVGGYDFVHGPLGSTEIYNPKTGRWNVMTNKLKIHRESFGAATLYYPCLPKKKYHTGL